MVHVTEKSLQQYSDKTLKSGEMRVVESHLGKCERCRARFAETEKINEVLNLTGIKTAPAGFTLKVMSLVATEISTAAESSIKWLTWRKGVFAFASIILIVSTTLIYSYRAEIVSALRSLDTTQSEQVERSVLGEYISKGLSAVGNLTRTLINSVSERQIEDSEILLVIFFFGTIVVYQVIEYLGKWLRHRSGTFITLV